MSLNFDLYFNNLKQWKSEFLLLREIILEHSELAEDGKWMHPCYTYNGKNVILIHGFKNYCGILFFKGALMIDPFQMLIQQTPNVQAARQLRFGSETQILNALPHIHQYINEAIQIEKDGRKVELKKTENYPIPIEFQQALDDDVNLKNAFNNLTPGRQNAYLYYFNQAKQSKTRNSRIEKYYLKILNGKGLNDYP